MNKFNTWLSERELVKTDITSNMLKNHLGLSVLNDAAFGNMQISDFDNYEDFRRKIVGWNAFSILNEIAKNNVINIIKNQSSRMRDIIAAMG